MKLETQLSFTDAQTEEVGVTYRFSDILAGIPMQGLRWLRLLGVVAIFAAAFPSVMELLDGEPVHNIVHDFNYWIPLFAIIITLGVLALSILVKFAAAKVRGNLGPVHLSLHADGLGVRSDNGEARLFWNSFARVRSNSSRSFFLLPRGRGLFTVPARCFSDRAAFERWAKFAEAQFRAAER